MSPGGRDGEPWSPTRYTGCPCPGCTLTPSPAMPASGYDNHPVPMVWSQLMAFGVYTYYLVALFGRQYYLYKDDVPASTPLYLDKSPIDFYVPMLSMVEFVFYISL